MPVLPVQLKRSSGLIAALACLLLVCAACSPIHGQPQSPPSAPATGGAATARQTQAEVTGSAQPLDRSCSTNADCQVKNVGSCCGYKPSCVHKDAQVDPQAVQAACAKSGMVGICGFRPVEACTCNQGRCTDVPGGMNAGGSAVSK